MSDEIMEIEESFADLLEKSIKTLNTGEKVTGVVTEITPTEIYVDLGTKHCFGTIAHTVCEYLGVDASTLDGQSVWEKIRK